MAEPTAPPTTPPAELPANPPANPPETPTPTPTPTAPQLGPDGKPRDPERAARTIAQQREEERKAKEERDAALAKLKEYEDKELTEQQRLEREADEAKAKAEEADARVAAANERIQTGNLLAELAKPEHGIVDARAAAKLIEGVEFNDDGEPTNLGDPKDEGSVLGGFLKSHSFLRASGKPPAPSIDAAPTGEPPEVTLTAEELKAAGEAGMSPQEFESRKGGLTYAEWEQLKARERAAAQ